MSRTETPHHTRDQIAGYVHDSEQLLQEAGYSDEERIALLPTIIGLFAAKSIVLAQPAPIGVPLGVLPGSVPRQ